MSENPTSTVVNGLDEMPAIKSEPIDPLLDEQPVIPKEYITSTTNGLHEDSDCEDIAYFTQIEVDNTRKCLENTRLIIKDFETQLDWHLQQYMTLRNIFNPRRNASKNSQNRNDDGSKRQDLLSISQLSAIIANHPEGNKKFIKRKGPISNGASGKKRRKNKESDSEEDESDFSDEESEEYDEEDFEEGNDSEDVDDPGSGKAKSKKKPRGRKGKNSDDPLIVPKDEIEEEIHELVVPKEEKHTDDDMDYEEDGRVVEKVVKIPAKRGRKPKVVDPNDDKAKTPTKRGPKGKRGQKNLDSNETIDLTNMKTCKVVLNRLQDESQDSIEIKDEDIDKDELNDLLQPKLIESIETFSIDPEKPIFILKEDNVRQFDFGECKTSNVVITFEDKEVLPEFVFMKNVANNILNGSIKLVHANVFDQHLNEGKD